MLNAILASYIDAPQSNLNKLESTDHHLYSLASNLSVLDWEDLSTKIAPVYRFNTKPNY